MKQPVLAELSTVFLLLTGNVSAAVVNGDFEAGLTGWTSLGTFTDTVTTSTSWTGDSVNAASGSMARVQSGHEDGAITNMLTSNIEANLNLAAGAFNAVAPAHPNPNRTITWAIGSAIYQDVSLASDGIIQFDWSFLSDTDHCYTCPLDGIFVVLDDNVTLLTTALANGGPVSLDWNTMQIEATAGTHRLAFVALNDFDPYYSTQVLVDNVTTSVVPLPPAIWLFGSGLLALARSRKKAAS